MVLQSFILQEGAGRLCVNPHITPECARTHGLALDTSVVMRSAGGARAYLTPVAVGAPAEVLVVAVAVRADPVSLAPLPDRAASTSAAAAIPSGALCTPERRKLVNNFRCGIPMQSQA